MPITITGFEIGARYAHDHYEETNRYNEIRVQGKDLSTEWQSMWVTLTPAQCRKALAYAANLVFVDPELAVSFDIPAGAVDPVAEAAVAERERLAAEVEEAPEWDKPTQNWDTESFEREEGLHEAAQADSLAPDEADDFKPEPRY